VSQWRASRRSSSSHGAVPTSSRWSRTSTPRCTHDRPWYKKDSNDGTDAALAEREMERDVAAGAEADHQDALDLRGTERPLDGRLRLIEELGDVETGRRKRALPEPGVAEAHQVEAQHGGPGGGP